MGNSQSQLSPEAKKAIEQAADKEKAEAVIKNIEDRRVMVDEVLTTNITELSKILQQFNTNDTENLVNRLKENSELSSKLPKDAMDRIGTIHKSLLDSIDAGVSDEEKKKMLQTDGGLSKHIQMFMDKEMDAKMKDYLSNPFIANDPTIQKNMVDITGSIKSIRSKYKFFEYKYIQMNLFLITFIKHVSDNMNKFINETIAFTEAREKYHLVLIHNVIKVFQEQLSSEAANMVNFDNTNISQLLTELTQGVIKTIDDQKELAESMRKQSLQEIIKYLMEKQSEFAQDIIGSVDEYQKAQPAIGPAEKPKYIAAATFDGVKPDYDFKTVDGKTGYYLKEGTAAPAPSADASKYPSIGASTSATGPSSPTRALSGGFPKDLSLFPQNFYQLG
jgi:hypothetical protein